MKTFEEFLEEKYDEINSNSNNMNREFENARDSWFENLDVQEVIDEAEKYAKLVFIDGQLDGLAKARKIFISDVN